MLSSVWLMMNGVFQNSATWPLAWVNEGHVAQPVRPALKSAFCTKGVRSAALPSSASRCR